MLNFAATPAIIGAFAAAGWRRFTRLEDTMKVSLTAAFALCSLTAYAQGGFGPPSGPIPSAQGGIVWYGMLRTGIGMMIISWTEPMTADVQIAGQDNQVLRGFVAMGRVANTRSQLAKHYSVATFAVER